MRSQNTVTTTLSMNLGQSRSLSERLKLRYIRNREDEGMPIPHWWLGRAYKNHYIDATVYLVIPFNLIVRKAREWLIAIRFPNRTQFELEEARRFNLRRVEFENIAYEKFLYNMVGKFTRKEMDLLEDFMTLNTFREKENGLLDDIHHNYQWLHHEYKDVQKDKLKSMHKA